MKTIVNLLLFIPLFSVIMSCENNRSADDLLNDPQEQNKVLTVIANDSVLLGKLHDKIKADGKINMNGSNPMMRSCMAMIDNPGNDEHDDGFRKYAKHDAGQNEGHGYGERQ